jgi:Arc/MetJ-type ribon-helix-helix transcriptional regulator
MTFRGIKMSDEMIERLERRALVLSLLRGRRVSWSELVREAVQRVLSEPEPTVTVSNA